MLDFDALDLRGFTLRDRNKFVFSTRHTHAAAIDRQPTGGDEDLAVSAEGVCLCAMIDGREPFGDFKLGVRKEDSNEALYDHVV